MAFVPCSDRLHMSKETKIFMNKKILLANDNQFFSNVFVDKLNHEKYN